MGISWSGPMDPGRGEGRTGLGKSCEFIPSDLWRTNCTPSIFEADTYGTGKKIDLLSTDNGPNGPDEKRPLSILHLLGIPGR